MSDNQDTSNTPIGASPVGADESGAPALLANIQQHPIIFRDQPVVTLSMIDMLHERPDGTAGRNLRHNRKRFTPDRDFWDVSTEDEFRRQLKKAGLIGARARSVILLSERGYLKLVKSFTDDLSWQIQDMLVDTYFRVKAAPIAVSVGVPDMAAALGQVGGAFTGLVAQCNKQRGALTKIASMCGSIMSTVRWTKGKDPAQMLFAFSAPEPGVGTVPLPGPERVRL